MGSGALNAYILATHTDDQKEDAIDNLSQFWDSLASIEPYSHWTGGFFYGFFFEKSIFNAQNMENFIYQMLSGRELKTKIAIGLTNFLNGK